MKRKDIVTHLINEGFSAKTLANFSDKALNLLSKRILSEQTPLPVTNVSSTDLPTQTALKQQKKPFSTYESEIKEDEDFDFGKFKSENKSEDKEKKEDKKGEGKRNSDSLKIEKLKLRIDCTKNKKILTKLKNRLESLEKKETKKEEPKEQRSAVIDVNKKKKTKKVKPVSSKGKSVKPKKKETKEQSFKTLSLREWVESVVEKNTYPFTSKYDIMKLIKTKLTEQEVMAQEKEVGVPEFLTYDEIKNAAETAEPTVKPKTPTIAPTKTPRPNKPPNPYKPGKGVNPGPKAIKNDEYEVNI